MSEFLKILENSIFFLFLLVKICWMSLPPPPTFKNDATCLEITHFFIPLFNNQNKLTNITDPDKYYYMYQK